MKHHELHALWRRDQRSIRTPHSLMRKFRVVVVMLATLACASTPLLAQRRITSTQLCSNEQRAAGCLLILGSGTPVPNPERSGPAYAVVYQDRTFLFDAGAGVMRRVGVAGLPINSFTGVFLTHLHSDHTLGLPDVMLTTWTMGRQNPFTVTGPPGTRAMTDHILSAWAEDIQMRTEGLEHGQRNGQKVNVVETKGGVVYDSAGVRITAIRVSHGTWKNAFGYVIQLPGRKIVLSGDTGPSEALFEAARDADILVHEAYPASKLKVENRPGGEDWPPYMKTFHTSDEEIGAMAKKANIKQVVLSHVVWMSGKPQDLIDGVHRGGFMGLLTIAKDLDVF